MLAHSEGAVALLGSIILLVMKVAVVSGVVVTASIGTWLWRRKYRRKDGNTIVVFSRYPTPGTTKTRLIPALGANGAQRAQLLMTNNLLDNIEDFTSKNKICRTQVHYYGGTESAVEYWLDRRKQLSWKLQSDGDLGMKMKTAFLSNFEEGENNVIVIGSDIPGINESILSDAVREISESCDMVLGPAADGGYYLVGMNRKALRKQQLDDVFTDIEWGTDKVFKQQSDKATACGLRLKILRTKLSDVDTAEDLHVVEKECGASIGSLKSPRWSIVIPVLNEEKDIKNTLADVLRKCSDMQCISELVIVDGGSTDKTKERVEEFMGESAVQIHLISSPPGRGKQQIAGAAKAKGDNLLFLHADTSLPKDFDIHALKCLDTPGNVAGSFGFSFDLLQDDEKLKQSSALFIWKMKMVAAITNRRSIHFELPYGDQALFMSRKMYDKVNGFNDYYLLEDVTLVEKLKKYGHVATIQDQHVVTSARRWEQYGFVKVTGMNGLIMLAYKIGFHPNTLAKWYYGKKLKTE